MSAKSPNNKPAYPGEAKEPIAIIGIGCRFPGGVNSPESFWQFLCNEGDAISEIPRDRIDLETYYDPQPATPGKMMTRWGGFLEQIDQFDAYFFSISPREAERLDPQQRLLLETAWEAIEDAGQVVDKLAGSQTGVFIGLWLNDYEARLFADPAVVDFYMTTGSGRYSASGRISYALGFQGPSLTIDTACSSSLVAVHLACQSLWNGECSLVLAGGANTILQPHISIAYSQSKMMAPDGHCKFGDARADGYVRSEGAGIVVLKPLSQAIADGDPIYAVIRGSAVNNDGQSSGFLATPGQQGQEAMLHKAYQDARVSPNQVQYIEAHGTGTRAGDPVELGALGAVLAPNRSKDQPCLVGSVKTNFGHTEGAAGVAGFIKVALSLYHRTIPASLHLQELNPNIPWQELGVTISNKLIPWPAEVGRGIAGVSAFGIAGTNAHVVLAEAPFRLPANISNERPQTNTYLLPLSAQTSEALTALAQVYKDFLSQDTPPSLADFCYSASCHRTHLTYRLALVAENRSDLLERLDDFIQSETSLNESGEQNHKIVFVFPGQGSQWLGMGRNLLAHEPDFRQMIEQCEAAMRPYVDWSLLEQLAADESSPNYRLNEIDVIQPTLLSIEIALAALWRSWGVEPDAVIGHSMGEVAAAYIAGALSLEHAMQVICRRSQLLKRTSGQGAMAMVELTVDETQAALAGYEDRLSIAVSNSPRSTVLSGDPAALDEVIKQLEERQVFCRLIKVDVASHSPQMDPLKADLLTALEGLKPQAAAIPIYSTALGQVTDGANFDPAYWVQNLRQPVLFSKMVQQLLADEHNIFIEMSPHPILLPAVQQGLQHANRTGTTLSSVRRNEEEQSAILASLGTLYTLGFPLDWAKLYPTGGNYVKLPLYPWQREHFWYEPSPSKRKAGQTSPGSHPLLGRYIASASGTHIWENEINLEFQPYLSDHKVQGTAVFPAAAYVEMALAAANEVFGSGIHIVENVVFKETLPLSEDKSQTVQLLLTPGLPGIASCQFFSRPAETTASTWTLLASATIRLNGTNTNGSTPTSPEIMLPEQPQEVISSAVYYQTMAARGLDYGPAFQGIGQLWPRQQGDGVSAELRLAQPAAGAYLIHPVLLDACFQLLLATLPAEGNFANSDIYLPVNLDKLQLFDRPQLADSWRGYAVRRSQEDELCGDVFLLNEAGQVVMAAYGLRFERLARDTQIKVDDWLYELQWQPQPLLKSNIARPAEAGTWLIFTDRDGIGRQAATRLTDLGEKCVLVSPGAEFRQVEPGQYQLNPASPEQYAQLVREVWPNQVTEGGNILHLWSLDSAGTDDLNLASLKSAQEIGSLSVVHLIQALNTVEIKTSPRLWLVTRGAQAVGSPAEPINVAQSPVWGLGRVIAHEHPELRCVRLDLSPTPQLDESAALLAELWADTPEDQVALRANQRYTARLVRYQLKDRQITTSPNQLEVAAESSPFQVEVDPPGLLDNLIARAVTRQKPKPGEVEIKVYHTGLNFMNIMSALGALPGYPNGVGPLGIECAGEIIAIGDGVTDFEPGDAVVAIAFDSLGSHAIADARLVVPKPVQLSYEDAATIPIVFLTAFYALHHLGRLQSGERVLIHAAAGGVGLAAIQLAQQVGAKIFVTAGSPEKREFLRSLGLQYIMDSRSLTFSQEIMSQTQGEGVDVVLNSLAGEAIPAGLACLRAYGRFLEIGKRDIYQNSQLGLLPFQKNLSYFAIDLDRMARERPDFIGAMLRQIMQQLEQGRLKPLPRQVFRVSQVVEAFRCMAQAKHIGKVVISLQDPEVSLVPTNNSSISIRSDATYLLTGGLGGLGLTVAKWLVDQGARHLVLTGRSGPSIAAQAIINQLEAGGVQVHVAQADVAQNQAVAGVLKEIEQSMPPLRGIIHAAGVLDDSSLLQLSREQFERVTAPKIEGAWNLHTLTQPMPLDFFILFSSVTALLGTPGQGNYAAANAFLDALAQHRHALGQPAQSLNWGPWSEVGLAAAQANRGERLAARGVASLTPQQGINALARLFQPDITQVAIMPFNLAQWTQFYPTAGKSPLFSSLEPSSAVDQPKEQKSTVRQALLAMEAGRRRQVLLETHIREQAALVLRLAPHRVPLDKPLKNLGLDSLMTLELRNRLEVSLGVSLSATLLWNYPTVAALTPFLAEKMGIPLLADAPSTESGSQTLDSEALPAALQFNEEVEIGPLTDLDQLSQAEVEAMLAEELAAIDDLLN